MSQSFGSDEASLREKRDSSLLLQNVPEIVYIQNQRLPSVSQMVPSPPTHPLNHPHKLTWIKARKASSLLRRNSASS